MSLRSLVGTIALVLIGVGGMRHPAAADGAPNELPACRQRVDAWLEQCLVACGRVSENTRAACAARCRDEGQLNMRLAQCESQRRVPRPDGARD
jgi:hypothetical protein